MKSYIGLYLFAFYPASTVSDAELSYRFVDGRGSKRFIEKKRKRGKGRGGGGGKEEEEEIISCYDDVPS